MPISTVQHYIRLQRQGKVTLHERLELLVRHRHEVQRQIRELTEYLALIEFKIRRYSALDSPDLEKCP